MSNSRYERVAAHDEDESPMNSNAPHQQYPIPASPPPSFRSRASSPSSRLRSGETEPLVSDADRTLADTFDSPSDDEDLDDENKDGLDDRQRLMRGNPDGSQEDDIPSNNTQDGNGGARQGSQRRMTQLPVFVPQPANGRRVYGGGSNDGVFANLSAKPTRGEQEDEKPPSYEQAAADATPPYWETTILAPGMVSDEVFVDGLPVGSVFSFVWNAMISMSFQLVGFLLTYLLHTTHAAKNGSRAGLGITLIQYGFSMKGANSSMGSPGGADFGGAPPDPNRHDFDPNTVGPEQGPVAEGSGTITTNDWLAYILMILGWFILIKSVNDFLKARRHEQLVLQSPDRGLSVPIVAEGERPESSV